MKVKFNGGIMRQGIKEKDIRDFEKYAKKLSDVVERIRKYNPEVSGFMNNDSICLMSGEWRDNIYNPQEKCVTSVNMPSFDGGAW